MTDTELTLSERIQRLGNPGISSHDVVAEDDVYDSEVQVWRELLAHWETLGANERAGLVAQYPALEVLEG